MDENKFDYKSLSVKKQYVWRACKQVLHDLKNGDCSEEDVDDLLSKTEPRSRGYFREEDFVTADEAMRILELGQNRNRFFALLKAYSIHAHTFNGVKIGYKRDDIYKLKGKINK
jgi:hypothetical protein